MSMVTGLGCGDLKVMQEFARVASIFGRNQVNVLQGLNRAKRHIRQVADGGTNDIKRAVAVEIRHNCVVLLAVLQNKPSRS